MSLRRSLYRLELNAPREVGDLLPHLGRFLGMVDATIFPSRYQHSARAQYAAACDASKRYFTEGIPFVSESGSESAWKSSQRIRDSLVEQGWAIACGSGRLKLSPEGDTIGRRACGLPSLNNDVTRLMFELLGSLPAERGDRWIEEGSLLDLTDEQRCDWGVIFELTELMLPLLSFRAIEAHSSTVARVYYRRLADSIPRIDVPEVERNDDFVDAYTTAFCKSMDARKTAEYGGTQVFVPFSAT